VRMFSTDSFKDGQFSGVGVLGDSFVPSEAGPGTHEVTYSVSNTYSTTVCTSSYVMSVAVEDCSGDGVYIIAGTVTGIVVVLVVTVIVVLYCRSKKKQQTTEMQMEEKSNNEELPIITDVEVKSRIGHGIFQLVNIFTHLTLGNFGEVTCFMLVEYF
jgi:hypothetical protein